eukprot:m.1063504 g.1063504  ORF g.1063504 m.1063504 type:complete len:82 (-) comp24216_c0_seq13:2138-2383(-)
MQEGMDGCQAYWLHLWVFGVDTIAAFATVASTTDVCVRFSVSDAAKIRVLSQADIPRVGLVRGSTGSTPAACVASHCVPST